MVDTPVAVLALAVATLLAAGEGADARRGPGCRGQGCGRGASEDHRVFQQLLDRRGDVRRRVVERPDGVETVTESDVAEVRDLIRTHVRGMERRLRAGRPIHARDPLFAEVFRHAAAITMTIADTPAGVRVTETSPDPYVADLIKAHARVVDAFIANGHAEMRRDHAVPARRSPASE